MKKLTDEQRQDATDFFRSIQDRLLSAFEQVDGSAKSKKKNWVRAEGGGGTTGVLRGQIVEKAGANFSEVQGDHYPAIESELKDKPFRATGVSTITHMMNPFAPIGHMNVRLIEVGDKFWFGGGADLTPMHPVEEDTTGFRKAFEEVCKAHPDEDAWQKFSHWCDEYFFIRHRNEPRGIGGIFFDYQKGSFTDYFPFVKLVAETYTEVFPRILNQRKDTPFTEEQKNAQLYWRGRYAEFNLVWDRGTRFGLMTGGNPEAIFVSLPPVVKW